MIREWLLPGLLETGIVGDDVFAIRDGMVNLFVVRGAAGLVCLDAGWRPSVVAKGFAVLGLDLAEVAAVFLTHWHWDHARGTQAFPNATVYVGEGENGRAGGRFVRQRVCDGQVVTVAGLAVRVVGTPGHTPGSVSYMVADRFLFTGDALRLRRGEVVPNWLGRDSESMRRSIGKVAGIEGLECLLTAHWGLSRQVREAFANTRSDPES